jgi:transcriptional regulator with XRE-family HTH domain
MEKIKIELVIERGDDKEFWGRVVYNDSFIVDHAPNIQQLEEQMKVLLADVEDLEIESIEFEHLYDVFALFEKFDFLNISKVANYAGINAGLLRQYASGVKNPSLNQAKKIEETLHLLAEQMRNAQVYVEA